MQVDHPMAKRSVHVYLPHASYKGCEAEILYRQMRMLVHTFTKRTDYALV